MNTVYLYGFGGASDSYRLLRYRYITEGITICLIGAIRDEASRMRLEYPSIKRIFAVDNSWVIRSAYNEAKRRPQVENNVAFIDLLERQGIEI